ncbi:hypothetical protein BOX15_Mlig011599g1, partial [Macrostomum lignano]
SNGNSQSETAAAPQTHDGEFAVPYPVPLKRHRTRSMADRAHKQPVQHGRVTYFCRQRGHGFILLTDTSQSTQAESIFVHISDIDEEYVPVPGDEVEFRMIPIPPKNEKYQAVHVRIIHLAPGVTHHKWSEPVDQ